MRPAGPPCSVGCTVSPSMSPALVNLLIFGTQRLKKGRREKALRARASRGGRKDAKARGADGSGIVEKTAEQRNRWGEAPIRLNSLPYSVGCSVSPKTSPTLFSLLFTGTQRVKKERRGKRCAPGRPLAETPGRKGSRSRGDLLSAQSEKNVGRNPHQTEQPTVFRTPYPVHTGEAHFFRIFRQRLPYAITSLRPAHPGAGSYWRLVGWQKDITLFEGLTANLAAYLREEGIDPTK